MPSSAATASATLRASPVIIATRMPCSRGARDGRARDVSYPVLQRQGARQLAVDRPRTGPMRRGLASRPQLPVHRGFVEPAQCSSRGPPTSRLSPFHPGADALAGRRDRKSLAAGTSPASCRCAHDGACEGVLRVRFGGCRQPKHCLVCAVRGQAGDHVLALGQRAGLVEQDDVDLAHALQGEAVFDENAVGADRGREGDDEGDGQAEGVGAGDHEDRHRACDRVSVARELTRRRR